MDLINIRTKEYPVSLSEFRRRFPLAPVAPNMNDFLKYGFAMVRPTELPILLPSQYVMEDAPVAITNKMYMQTWAVIDYPEESHLDKTIALYKEMGVAFITENRDADGEKMTVISDVNGATLAFDEKGTFMKQDVKVTAEVKL